MNVNDLRAAVTVVTFMVFLAIVVWTLSRRNKAQFDEAAQVPFLEDESASLSAESTPRRSLKE